MTVEHFSTPVPQKVYSADYLYTANDTTTDMEQFSTPLQKLSNNSLNDVRLPNKGREVLPERYYNIREDNRENKLADSSNEGNIVNPVNNNNASLTPLSDVAFQLYQTKLTIDSHKGHPHHTNTFKQQRAIGSGKEPIYYRPPSSSEGAQYGIKSFLPPNFEKGSIRDRTTNKVPIAANTPEIYQKDSIFVKDDDEIDEIEDANSNPTGDWFNPVVKEALRRQPRREVEIKIIGTNLLYLLAFKLSVAVGNYFLTLYEYKRMPFQSVGGYYPPIRHDHTHPGTVGFYTILAIRVIYGIFLFNCILSFYRLTKGQDQCLDLPLNNKQRELLGLRVDQTSNEDINEKEGAEEDAQLTMKQRRFQSQHNGNYILPKYTKSNIYSVHQVKPTMRVNEKFHDPTDLTLSDKLIQTRLIHTPSYKLKHRDTHKDLETSFHKKYNIEFNYSDDEDS
ncbi:uncharacterized protein AC631_03097 [Debaryomyces fabryi]|uniref:Uncharacterized protein n=1 Tax=Debaryomyces fabryi TaxID=58627 RepID=A0A0V1PY14_9ASCO|nr:uncharacterized protein AC631_03097 [Debaryomyces fabryi]KSA01156.1 hypothetical protein AC631_03097 [Debaryomyces fabryi]CUM46386.1 unnamed protein product [Debaryomyces fabryi]